jgi:hypothetical protein
LPWRNARRTERYPEKCPEKFTERHLEKHLETSPATPQETIPGKFHKKSQGKHPERRTASRLPKFPFRRRARVIIEALLHNTHQRRCNIIVPAHYWNPRKFTQHLGTRNWILVFLSATSASENELHETMLLSQRRRSPLPQVGDSL